MATQTESTQATDNERVVDNANLFGRFYARMIKRDIKIKVSAHAVSIMLTSFVTYTVFVNTFNAIGLTGRFIAAVSVFLSIIVSLSIESGFTDQWHLFFRQKLYEGNGESWIRMKKVNLFKLILFSVLNPLTLTIGGINVGNNVLPTYKGYDVSKLHSVFQSQKSEVDSKAEKRVSYYSDLQKGQEELIKAKYEKLIASAEAEQVRWDSLEKIRNKTYLSLKTKAIQQAQKYAADMAGELAAVSSKYEEKRQSELNAAIAEKERIESVYQERKNQLEETHGTGRTIHNTTRWTLKIFSVLVGFFAWVVVIFASYQEELYAFETRQDMGAEEADLTDSAFRRLQASLGSNVQTRLHNLAAMAESVAPEKRDREYYRQNGFKVFQRVGSVEAREAERQAKQMAERLKEEEKIAELTRQIQDLKAKLSTVVEQKPAVPTVVPKAEAPARPPEKESASVSERPDFSRPLLNIGKVQYQEGRTKIKGLEIEMRSGQAFFVHKFKKKGKALEALKDQDYCRTAQGTYKTRVKESTEKLVQLELQGGSEKSIARARRALENRNEKYRYWSLAYIVLQSLNKQFNNQFK
jgi:hypothetical protein